MSNTIRARALRLYKNCLATSRRWQALEPSNTQAEREYIEQETKRAFAANRGDTERAADLVDEGEKRYEYALHYQIPYPRLPVHPRFWKKVPKTAPLPPPKASRKPEDR